MSSKTVQEVTFDLMRALDLKTVFGNPGSTEQPFLKNFPSDFEYILGLQEASVVAMADGFAQAAGKPAFVNLHTSAGTGNAMGTLMTAFLNKTPLIVTAGQQTREMIISDPLLTNRDETQLPKPWVKWAYQPVRAEDVPACFMRGYAIALQPPAGPVYISIPLDDWDKPALGPAIVRTVSYRFAPDPNRLKDFAERIQKSKKPVLIYGAEIDRSGGWEEAIKLAERLRSPVFTAPICERAPFPENHPQYQGVLPPAIGPLSKRLAGYDLAIVIGAPVFRYYPYVAGSYVPEGTEVLQITIDASDAGSAAVGDSLLGDVKLAMQQLIELLPATKVRDLPKPLNMKRELPAQSSQPLTPGEAYAALSELRPDDAIVVQESPSNMLELMQWWPTLKPESYYSYASGGLGWNMPAAVGIALAEKSKEKPRPVVAFIGDGSFQYSVQSIYTAVQQKLKIVYIVFCNGEYAILKSFAVLEKTPGVPALDLPGLDVVSTAKGFGCTGVTAKTKDEIKAAFAKALKSDGPTLIAIPITPGFHPLVPA
jgi:benzoylformate decarboxylase